MKDGLNQRVFDVPAAGGFLLTDFKESLLDLFKEGEVACFHDPEEARAKLQYFQTRPEERRAVAAKARERVLAQHTVAHRVQTVLEKLGAVFF
jgi:spore maturation protein CgeB